jgi:uncharacterized protein
MMGSKLLLLAETIVLIFLPLILFAYTPQLLHFRTLLMILGFIYISYIIYKKKIDHRSLGLTFKNLIPSLRSVLLPTFFVLAIMFMSIPVGWDSKFFFIKDMVEEIKGKPIGSNYLYAIFISAPIQEIIFRSFYISRLEVISKNKYFLILWSAAVFSLIHTPFKNNLFTVFTFVLGIIYADNFLKYRNLLAIIISHALLLCGVIFQVLY